MPIGFLMCRKPVTPDEMIAMVVPAILPEHRARFDAVVACLRTFCERHLAPVSNEYLVLAILMASSYCDADSPMMAPQAQPAAWAAGIIAALGFVNFLGSPERSPSMTVAQIAAGFGVGESTLHAKSREIRREFELMQFDPMWTIPSRLHDNPFVWMIQTPSGMVVDIRHLPRPEREKAYALGLIPFVPDDPPSVEARLAAAKNSARTKRKPEAGDDALFEVVTKIGQRTSSGDVLARIGPDAARAPQR